MMVATVAATTDPARHAGRRVGGPDRVSVGLFALNAFLAVLALLISQLHVAAPAPRPKLVVVRRVYRTTVIETVIGRRGGGTSVSQSSSSSSTPVSATAAAPTTRVS
jgi:hypothetical protein